MAIFGEDDRKWVLSYCVGCRQTTWHYDGLCSNRDFHRGTDYTMAISDAAAAAAVAAATERQGQVEAVHDESAAED
jgi:hypothetical protein